jgi:pyruvate dehydrogenase E1 component
VLANTVPNLLSYDPAFSFELAVIVREGIRRMYTEQEDVFYYVTVYNENYPQPALPDGSDDGILRGIYCFRKADEFLTDNENPQVHLLGSGSIMQQALQAQEELARQGIAADVYSVTSYNLLYRDAMNCEKWNRDNPDDKEKIPFLTKVLNGATGRFIAVSDYMKVLPASIAKWVPGELVCLGTDGYGLSESRPVIREHFGISSEHIVQAALQRPAG